MEHAIMPLADYKDLCDAIRAKLGVDEYIASSDLATKIREIPVGVTASENDVNFYDHDGTLLYSYTKEEALALTEMPAIPQHAGTPLYCQGWNWSFENMQSYVGKYGKCNVGATYSVSDGKTRIYITLQEGRTSPMLGVCPNGTVTVDWGDGTDPDVLTGTDITVLAWTPTHDYFEAGDYVISLTVDGEMAFRFDSSNGVNSILLHSSSKDDRNAAYYCAIKKIEIGDGVTSIGAGAFYFCRALANVVIPNSVTSIDLMAFASCDSLANIVLPNSVTSIGKSLFSDSMALANVVLPDSVTSIDEKAFYRCCALANVVIPDGVTSIGRDAFSYCQPLTNIVLPDSVTSIGRYAFFYCQALANVVIPDGVTSISAGAFENCRALANVVIPDGVTSIGQDAFSYCYAISFYDFTACTSVVTLDNINAFNGIASDCEIRVPAALYDEWIAATNWSTYADYIVAV